MKAVTYGRLIPLLEKEWLSTEKLCLKNYALIVTEAENHSPEVAPLNTQEQFRAEKKIHQI